MYHFTYHIERRHRSATIWWPDGAAATRAEAERGVRNCKDIDADRFGHESHEYRIVERAEICTDDRDHAL